MMGPKKFWVLKNLGQRKFGPKNEVQNILSQTKFIKKKVDTKNLRAPPKMGPKCFV